MINSINLLEELHGKVDNMHTELLKAMSLKTSPEQIPIVKCLMSEEVSHYKQRMKVIARANQLTKKYRTIRAVKRKADDSNFPLPKRQCKLKDDPLTMATRTSSGRPKGKRVKKGINNCAYFVVTIIQYSTSFVYILGFYDDTVVTGPQLACDSKKQNDEGNTSDKNLSSYVCDFYICGIII